MIKFSNNITSIMRGQFKANAIIDVCPKRMMIHLFSYNSYSRHETKSLNEIFKLKSFGEPVVFFLDPHSSKAKVRLIQVR